MKTNLQQFKNFAPMPKNFFASDALLGVPTSKHSLNLIFLSFGPLSLQKSLWAPTWAPEEINSVDTD